MDRSTFDSLIELGRIRVLRAAAFSAKRPPVVGLNRLSRYKTAAKRPFGMRVTQVNAGVVPPLKEKKRRRVFQARHAWRPLPRKRVPGTAAFYAPRDMADELLRAFDREPDLRRVLSDRSADRLRASCQASAVVVQEPARQSRTQDLPEQEPQRIDRLLIRLSSRTEMAYGAGIGLWVIGSVVLFVCKLLEVSVGASVAVSLALLWTAMLVQRLAVDIPLPSAKTIVASCSMTALTVVQVLAYKTDVYSCVTGCLLMGTVCVLASLGRKVKHLAYLYSVVSVAGILVSSDIPLALSPVLVAAACFLGVVFKEAMLRWRICGDLYNVKTALRLFLIILIAVPVLVLLATASALYSVR